MSERPQLVPDTLYSIVALWCVPRSMSTTVERVMRARGDCACFHEPFMYDYYVGRSVREMPHFEPDPERPTHYRDIRASLVEAAVEQTVFFKDMSYYVVPQIFDDREFNARLRNVFLIRDPRRSIVSYFKLDPHVTRAEIGFDSQWRHVEWLEESTGQSPLILEAEFVRRDPESAMNRLWNAVGLAPMKEALHWKPETVPEGWEEVAGWHEDILHSGGIRAAVDEPDPDEVFESVAKAAPHLEEYLDHHRPYYERLRARASSNPEKTGLE